MCICMSVCVRACVCVRKVSFIRIKRCVCERGTNSAASKKSCRQKSAHVIRITMCVRACVRACVLLHQKQEVYLPHMHLYKRGIDLL